jgi:hypothetical protein
VRLATTSIGDAEIYVDANGAYQRKQAIRVTAGGTAAVDWQAPGNGLTFRHADATEWRVA